MLPLMSELHDPGIFRTVLESLQLGICLVDRHYIIAFWNDGAERITGYHRHEVVGHSCRDNILLTCNEQGCVLCGASCPFVHTMHDGRPREARLLLRHKEGHHVPVRLCLAPVRDSHGSIIGMVESFDEQRFTSERDRRQNNLAVYGCLDEITGVPNHEFTQFHLRENLASFAQYHVPFGIMCIRVDKLKEFSSSYGREAGDAILRVVAHTIQNSLRPTDFVGRWTDDRFLAILMNCTVAEVETASERIQRLIGVAELRWWGDQLLVTTSVGHSAAQGGDSLELLLERAQRSMDESSQRRRAAAGHSKS